MCLELKDSYPEVYGRRVRVCAISATMQLECAVGARRKLRYSICISASTSFSNSCVGIEGLQGQNCVFLWGTERRVQRNSDAISPVT